MNYRKAILLNAYVVPLAIALVIALVLLVGPARFKASQQSRLADYQAAEGLNAQLVTLDAKIMPKRKLMAAWRDSLNSEFNTTLNNLISSRLESMDGKQLELESSGGRPDGGSGLSITGGQPAMRTKIIFRGGYEPMQETLLVLENKLPQMQLEAIDVSEHQNGETLKFDLTYTVWDKSTSVTK